GLANALWMGVDDEALTASEPADRDPGPVREIESQARGAADSHDGPDSARHRLRDDVETDPSADTQDDRGGRFARWPARHRPELPGAEHLVDRVVASDVLPRDHQSAGRVERACRMERPRS